MTQSEQPPLLVAQGRLVENECNSENNKINELRREINELKQKLNNTPKGDLVDSEPLAPPPPCPPCPPSPVQPPSPRPSPTKRSPPTPVQPPSNSSRSPPPPPTPPPPPASQPPDNLRRSAFHQQSQDLYKQVMKDQIEQLNNPHLVRDRHKQSEIRSRRNTKPTPRQLPETSTPIEQQVPQQEIIQKL